MKVNFKHKEIELTQVDDIVEASLHEPEKVSCSTFDNSDKENRRSFATVDFRVGRERIVIFLNKESAKMLSEKANKVSQFFEKVEKNGRSKQV